MVEIYRIWPDLVSKDCGQEPIDVCHSRHGHRKTFDSHIVIEGLQDVARRQGMVHASIFVLFQTLELVRSDINHVDRLWMLRKHCVGGERMLKVPWWAGRIAC